MKEIVRSGKRYCRSVICLAALLIMFFVQSLSVQTVYGSEIHYVRDGNIDFYLSDGWEVTEIMPEESSGSFEQILAARGDGTTFDLYYHKGEAAEHLYFDEDAETYYNEQGQDVVESFYSAEYAGAQTTLSAPEIFEGKWDTYLKIDVELRTGALTDEQVVYLTARSSFLTEESGTTELVDRLFVFGSEESGALTASELEVTAEPIVNEFYDFGYDDILMGDKESQAVYDDSYEGETSGAGDVLDTVIDIVSSLLPVAVIVIVIAIMLRRRRKSRNFNAAVRHDGGRAGDRKVREKARTEERGILKADAAKPEKKQKKAKEAEETVRDKIPAGDSYLRSLETLRKSGLVTRKEMQELLVRYERTRNELKRRKRRKN